MKKNVRILLVAFALLLSGGMYAQVGIGTNQPEKSAALDILSSSRGLLIPRIDLGDATDVTMMASAPVTSLLVYNTDADVTGLKAGFYYWDAVAAAWVQLKDGQNQLQVLAENGLTLDVTDPNNPIVKLGGKLTASTPGTATTTTIDFMDVDGTTQHSLAFKNMTAADAAATNKIVVTDDLTGELHTVIRSLYATLTTTTTIDGTSISGYSPHVQEIYVEVDAVSLQTLNSDVKITLPDPSVAQGQEITIKITDNGTTPVGEGVAYLEIFQNDGTSITYGALPYQSWVLQSNGTTWRVVASN